MSKLASPNGDDYPEAATKHLIDAGLLLSANRPDGAAYLSGYVVECALKSIFLLETGDARWGHDLAELSLQVGFVATMSGARTARYFGKATAGVSSSAIAAWKSELRYRAASIGEADAAKWHAIAQDVYQETIAAMQLDGEL